MSIQNKILQVKLLLLTKVYLVSIAKEIFFQTLQSYTVKDDGEVSHSQKIKKKLNLGAKQKCDLTL